jgi:polyphosphate kinase
MTLNPAAQLAAPASAVRDDKATRPKIMDAPALTSPRPDLFINRELAQLAFNRRVLELAEDESVPLLERLRFLCVSSTNLDEFFEIRVAGLKQQVALGISRVGADGLSPQEQLAQITVEAHKLVDDQYRVLNEILIPALDTEDIRFVRRSEWSETQAKWVKKHFIGELFPVLSPLGLDPSHPFPRILNKSLNFVVTLEGKDAFGRDSGVALVQAPRSLPRLIRLPEHISRKGHHFVFLSSILHTHVGELFPGMQVLGCAQFRATRNSDLFVAEEEIDDLLIALQGELPSRNYGDAVRLEVADNCSQRATRFLLQRFRLQPEDLYRVNGPVNLNRLLALHEIVDRPDLKYHPFNPTLPRALSTRGNVFERIARGDILLHHPYQSFTPVIEFVRQAAHDPHVLAIKQTLYRTESDSELVELLVAAARAGKEVTTVIELRARFDEAANIKLANRLQDAGAHVLYGVVDYKTHAKLMLIVRREKNRLKRYVHLGTGNYHAGTARAYTDYGLLTCDRVIGEDVHKIFQQLTGLGRVSRLKKLLQSPFTLHKELMNKIEREREFAAAGKTGHIMARMNALIEPQMIQALYRASQAGVKIELIVRGICGLRPGIPGVSENIHVRSVMGRFLEHSRVYCFHNDGAPEVYCSSADWMPRNFFRRVETCFPIEDERLRERVVEESLLYFLADNTQAWELQQDGQYKRVKSGNRKPRSAQSELINKLTEN